MSHSLVVVSPVTRLQVVDGRHIEPLAALIGGDGVLTIPLVRPEDLGTVTHYTCHHGGTAPSAARMIEALYAGADLSGVMTLPGSLTPAAIAAALPVVRASVDGRLMGIDDDWPEPRLTGRAHLDQVIARLGLMLMPAPEVEEGE